jgi:penicillin-binding protein-related factor A (putative recombinase)
MAEIPVVPEECPLEVEQELWRYRDSVIKAVQYKSNTLANVLKLLFTYVLKDPTNITFAVDIDPLTSYKKITFKYLDSSTINVLKINDYLVVKEKENNTPYLEAIPQLVLEGSYVPLDEVEVEPGDSLSLLDEINALKTSLETVQDSLTTFVPKNFVYDAWNKTEESDNWWITALQVVAHPTNPTKKINVEAYFANPLDKTTKTEVFTLELGDGLSFDAGETANSIKIKTS